VLLLGFCLANRGLITKLILCDVLFLERFLPDKGLFGDLSEVLLRPYVVDLLKLERDL